MECDQRPAPRSNFFSITVSTAHVLIALRLQKCCRGNRMEMGIIMYSWCRRPGGCGACSLGTALYPEPDVSGQNHSTQDSSRILRSHDRMEGRREGERQKKDGGSTERRGQKWRMMINKKNEERVKDIRGKQWLDWCYSKERRRAYMSPVEPSKHKRQKI